MLAIRPASLPAIDAASRPGRRDMRWELPGRNDGKQPLVPLQCFYQRRLAGKVAPVGVRMKVCEGDHGIQIVHVRDLRLDL